MGLTVGELSVELEARTREFQQGLQRAERRIARFEGTATRRVGRAGSAFRRLGSVVAGVTTAVVALGAAIAAIGLVRFISEGVRSAATFESIGISLEVLTGSAEGAAQVLDEVNKLVVQTPFGLEQTASAARSLAVVFGQNTDAVSEFTGIAADLAAAFQRPVEVIGENLTRAFNAGLGSAEILRDSGITPLILEIAGVTDVAKLTTEQFVDALRVLTEEGGRAFGAAAAQAESLGGALSNTSIAFDTLRRASGEAIAPALQDILLNVLQPLFMRLEAIVRDNADAINDFASRALPALINGLENVARFVASTLRVLGGLATAFDVVQTVLAAVQLNVVITTEFFRTFGTIIKNQADIVIKVFTAIGQAATLEFGAARMTLVSIGEDVEDVGRRFQEAGNNVVAAVSVVTDNVADIGDASSTLNALAATIDRTTDSARALIDEVTAAGPVEEEVAARTRADVSDVIAKDPKAKGMEEGESFGASFGDAVGAAFNRGIKGEEVNLVGSFANLLQDQSESSLSTAFESAIGEFGTLLTGVLSDAGGAIAGLFGGAEGPLGSIGGFLSDKLGEDAGMLCGGVATGVVGAGISALTRTQEGRAMAAGGITSAVESAERVRGIVAGPTSIAVAQVDRAIADAFIEPTRLLAIIAENTARTATQTSDTGTGSIPSGGTSEATQALGNEGASLV